MNAFEASARMERLVTVHPFRISFEYTTPGNPVTSFPFVTSALGALPSVHLDLPQITQNDQTKCTIADTRGLPKSSKRIQ